MYIITTHDLGPTGQKTKGAVWLSTVGDVITEVLDARDDGRHVSVIGSKTGAVIWADPTLPADVAAGLQAYGAMVKNQNPDSAMA